MTGDEAYGGAGEGGRDFTRPDFPEGVAWERVCKEAAALGVAFARFKLALDDYAAITGKKEPFA